MNESTFVLRALYFIFNVFTVFKSWFFELSNCYVVVYVFLFTLFRPKKNLPFKEGFFYKICCCSHYTIPSLILVIRITTTLIKEIIISELKFSIYDTVRSVLLSTQQILKLNIKKQNSLDTFLKESYKFDELSKYHGTYHRNHNEARFFFHLSNY